MRWNELRKVHSKRGIGMMPLDNKGISNVITLEQEDQREKGVTLDLS
jgi:hypothetical protein